MKIKKDTIQNILLIAIVPFSYFVIWYITWIADDGYATGYGWLHCTNIIWLVVLFIMNLWFIFGDIDEMEKQIKGDK